MISKIKADGLLCFATLPPLDPAYARIDKLIRHGQPAELSISSILAEEDPAISMMLLKLVNSPMYTLTGPAKNVADAVRLLGQEPVRDLVLAVCMSRILGRESPDIVTKQAFWTHSIACGIAARSLARHLKVQNIERFFLAGLLHDMGSLLMYGYISEKALMKILRERHEKGPLYLLEEEILGYDHAEVGACFAESLGLPLWLQEAIHYHHAPQATPHFSLESAAVHVADIIVNAMKYGTRGEFMVPPVSPAAWDALQLSPAILKSVIDEVDTATPSLMKSLLG